MKKYHPFSQETSSDGVDWFVIIEGLQNEILGQELYNACALVTEGVCR